MAAVSDIPPHNLQAGPPAGLHAPRVEPGRPTPLVRVRLPQGLGPGGEGYDGGGGSSRASAGARGPAIMR